MAALRVERARVRHADVSAAGERGASVIAAQRRDPEGCVVSALDLRHSAEGTQTSEHNRRVGRASSARTRFVW
jgi:hypothetical protein